MPEYLSKTIERPPTNRNGSIENQLKVMNVGDRSFIYGLITIIEYARYQAETVSDHCIHVAEPGYETLHHAQRERGGLLH